MVTANIEIPVLPADKTTDEGLNVAVVPDGMLEVEREMDPPSPLTLLIVIVDDPDAPCRIVERSVGFAERPKSGKGIGVTERSSVTE